MPPGRSLRVRSLVLRSKWPVGKNQVRIEAVADAIAVGRDVDWDTLGTRATSDQAETLRQLRRLGELRSPGLRERQLSSETGVATTRWFRALLLASRLQLLTAFVWTVWLITRRQATFDAPLAFPVMPLVYALSSGILLWGERRDLAARYLGGFFLLIASAFAGTTAAMLSSSAAGSWAPLTFVLDLPLDAFLPPLLFAFVANFPPLPAFVRPQAIANRVGRFSLACAAVLFVANVLPASLPLAWRRALAILDRTQPASSAYWTVVAALSLAAVATALWKARSVLGEERSKCSALVAAVGVGILPLALSTVAVGIGGPMQAWVVSRRASLGVLVYGSLLSVPITTAYLVRSRAVLSLRFGFGHSLYRILKALPAGGFLTFIVGLAAYVAGHPSMALTAALAEPLFLVLLAATGGTAAWTLYRARWADFIEHGLFHERRDLGQSVVAVAAPPGPAGSMAVVRALFREIARSLRASSASLLVLDAGRKCYVPIEGRCRCALPAETMLAELATVSREPIALDTDATDSVAEWLPEGDRQWFTDIDARLLVPISSVDGSDVAMIALGPKSSGLVYSSRDLRFIVQLTNATAALLVADGTRPVVAAERGQLEAMAYECETCGRVADHEGTCACGGDLRECPLPLMVAGKFRVEQRVGRGGRGVVYRAEDLALLRSVAIKTLPRTSVHEATRLRHEAQVMARLIHPNLAAIFGLETWRGLPMLIVEFLAGGTLADRLRSGPLPVKQVIALGQALASGLASMHAVGLLHRDIKPSNIGFNEDQTPKLLDFGLANLLADRDRSSSPSTGSSVDRRLSSLDLMGTPAYAPPARYCLDPSDPCRDLWSLALVLYEAVAATNPLLDRPDGQAPVDDLPSVLTYAPACPPSFAAFLDHALSSSPSRRPQTARAFISAMNDLDLRVP
jgi:hypothetical protein